MSKAAVIGAVVIIGVGAIGGGGYYYMSYKANQELHNTIDLIKKSIPGSSIEYKTSSVSPFSQSATLGKVIFKDGQGQVYTADTFTVSGVAKDKIGQISVDKLHAVIEDRAVDIAHVDVSNVVAAAGAVLVEDGKIKNIFPSKASFDLLNVKDVAIGEQNKGGTLTVGQYEVKNYGANRKSDQLLKQVVIKINGSNGADDISLKLNQAQIVGLELARLIADVEQEKVPQMIPGQPQKATLNGFEFQGQGKKWSLDQFNTENSVDQNGNLKSSGELAGLKMNTDHDEKLLPLKQMGYDQLEASGKLTGSYNKAKQQWSFAPLTFTIKDMGTVSTNLEFNGSENLSNVDPMRLMSDYKLISLNLTLQNQGLLQKILEKKAKEQNISVDQARQKTIDMLKQDAATAVTPAPNQEDATSDMSAQNAKSAVMPIQKQGDEAVIDLINDPKKTLVINMKPATPVGLMDLAGNSPVAIIEKLNLDIKTEVTK